MGLRKDRLADEIRDIMATAFSSGRMNDPRLAEVTITAVKLSGDLQVASVYFRLFEKDHQKAALEGLESCKGFLKHKLATSLSVRRVPELRFYHDDSVEYGANIEELLARLKN
jgi:ribosome-binding factor A